MKEGNIIELSTGLEKPCPYYFGDKVLPSFPRYLNRHQYDRVVVVTSPTLLDLFGRDLVATMTGAGITPTVLTIEEGEANKNWDNLSTLCERLLEQGVTRRSILIALGGGVIGNIVGMAAGLIYRGIRYIEMPTTLMAQTDGTLSNKQAINGRTGKNHFGLYHAPIFIWSDVDYARREPARATRSAIVESIKNGFIQDPQWLSSLADQLHSGLDNLRANLGEFALGLIRSKLPILARDPSEKKYAITLEYGHTFGHAMEFLSKGALYHGEAVGVGMCVAARLSFNLGFMSKDVLELHHRLIGDLLGSFVQVPAGLEPRAIYQAMLHDNKRTGRELRCLLLEQPGKFHDPDGDYQVAVNEEDVLRALEQCRAKA